MTTDAIRHVRRVAELAAAVADQLERMDPPPSLLALCRLLLCCDEAGAELERHLGDLQQLHRDRQQQRDT